MGIFKKISYEREKFFLVILILIKGNLNDIKYARVYLLKFGFLWSGKFGGFRFLMEIMTSSYGMNLVG